MNIQSVLKPAATIAALLLLSTAQSAMITKAEYQASKTRVSADYKTEKSACRSLSGNTKDVCIEEAKAKEKVALADLEFSFTGKTEDRNKALVARAESNYSVAKEKCDDKAGNDKDVCVKEAKALEVRALADAKMGKEMAEARKDASNDKRDADYKVALERCDSSAGDAKANCVSAAKSRFGMPS
jgi:hypothetical protein